MMFTGQEVYRFCERAAVVAVAAALDYFDIIPGYWCAAGAAVYLIVNMLQVVIIKELGITVAHLKGQWPA